MCLPGLAIRSWRAVWRQRSPGSMASLRLREVHHFEGRWRCWARSHLTTNRPPARSPVQESPRTGCKHLIGRFPRTTGSNLARPTFWHTLKTNASGCHRPLKQWCLVLVYKHGHGGCDDNSGDTRLARGLPFGRMSVIHPPHPMPDKM